MINNVIKNLKEKKIKKDDINYIIQLNNQKELETLHNISNEITKNNHPNVTLETNIKYPIMYQIKDNCPTCGYKTPESRREYNPEYIKNQLMMRLYKIDKYKIQSVNCYNDFNDFNTEQLKLLTNTIYEKTNAKCNIQLNKLNNLDNLTMFPIDNIICNLPSTNNYLFKLNNNKESLDNTLKLCEIISRNSKINLSIQFMINIRESYIDLTNLFKNFLKYNIKSIEIKGYDPFYDSPEEYHPQYSLDYMTKISNVLRILFPEQNIKTQIPTDNPEIIKELLNNGIDTITGVYTDSTNPSVYNIDKVLKIIGKSNTF